MILRLTTVYENARSVLDCGTVIFMAARNLALSWNRRPQVKNRARFLALLAMTKASLVAGGRIELPT